MLPLWLLPSVEGLSPSVVPEVPETRWGALVQGDRSRSVSPVRSSDTYMCTGRKHCSAEEKCRKASWGSYAKLRVMDGRVDLSHATGITSLIATAVLDSVPETSAWITPSPVTWTCWIVGIHVESMTMLVTVVSPACRRLRRVGVCHSNPGTCFFFCRRKRTTRLRGRFFRGSQVSSFDP